MRPLAELPSAIRAKIRYLLTDIDDTLTEGGRLPSSSLLAMERLQGAGLRVVPVTGRPAGWCDHVARMWPVDAVVGENGALWYAYDRAARVMRAGYAKPEEERRRDRRKLDDLCRLILEAVPGAGVASDQFCRVADLAIDFREDVVPLSEDEIERIVVLFREAGANAKVSSIHVNGWFGDYDKLSGTRDCFAAIFGADLEAVNETCVFVGDSPNDQPLFAFFRHGVGVANVRGFALDSPPAWVTEGRSAAGFGELAEALLAAR